MSKMNRDEFLNSHWQRYPKIPQGWLAGRIVSPEKVLTANNEKVELKLDFNLYSLGDVIAWNADKSEIILLAPCLARAQLIDQNHLALKWSDFLASVRNFFKSRGFNEVQTPTLVQSSGAETYLDPFITAPKKFYLPTSPEFHLKKLLALGLNKIFEIKTCFRDEEVSQHHQLEFTMLEWYRGFSDLNAALNDTVELLKTVCGQEKIAIESMQSLFKKYLDFDLTPTTSIQELAKITKPHASDTWNDLFFRIFLEKIEPVIGRDAPVIVKDFPPTMAALARLNEKGWADRFELYWRGLEIANAYDELNDPAENLKRLELWNQEKKSLDRKQVPISEDLMSAMKAGLPPSSGIALGLDRLFMALNKTDDIRETRFFPL